MPNGNGVTKEFWALGLPKNLPISPKLLTNPLVDWNQNHTAIAGGIRIVLMFTENRNVDRFRQRQIKDQAKAGNVREVVVEEFKSTARFLDRLQQLIDEKEKEMAQGSGGTVLNTQSVHLNGSGNGMSAGGWSSKDVPRHLSMPPEHSVLIVGADERRCFGQVKNDAVHYTLCACAAVEKSPVTLDYIGAVILLKTVPHDLREWFRKVASDRKINLFEPEWLEPEVNSWANSFPVVESDGRTTQSIGTSSGSGAKPQSEEVVGGKLPEPPKEGSVTADTNVLAEQASVSNVSPTNGDVSPKKPLAELLQLLGRFTELAPTALADSASLERMLEEEKVKYRLFESENEELKAAVKDLNNQLKESKAAIANLQTAKAMLDATLVQKQNSIQKLEEENEHLRNDLNLISQMAAKASNGK